MISDSKKILFIHIPKNAGTSVERTVFSDFDFIDSFSDIDLYGYDETLGVNLHHATLNQLIEFNFVSKRKLESYNTFAIVRNPYTRALSGYVWLMRDLKIEDTFENFLLEKGKFSSLSLKSQNKFVLDHFYSQSKFIMINNRIGVKDILRFEKIDVDFHVYMQKIGFDYKISSHFKKNKINKFELMKYLTKKNKEIIREKYKDDFENFDYDKNINNIRYLFGNV